MNDYNPIVFILTLLAMLIFAFVGFDFLIYHQLINESTNLHWFIETFMFEIGAYKKFLQGEIIFKVISTFLLISAVWIIPSTRKYKKSKRTRNTIILLVFCGLYWIGFIGIPEYDLILYPIFTIIHIILIFVVIRSYSKILRDENILGVTSKGQHQEYSFSFKVEPDKEEDRK